MKSKGDRFLTRFGSRTKRREASAVLGGGDGGHPSVRAATPTAVPSMQRGGAPPRAWDYISHASLRGGRGLVGDAPCAMPAGSGSPRAVRRYARRQRAAVTEAARARGGVYGAGGARSSAGSEA